MLNGPWLFQPLIGAEAIPPSGAWGTISVPGSWDSQPEWGNAVMPSFIGRPPVWPGVTVRAESGPSRIYLSKVTRAWYEREITVPKDWGGRRIFVHFSRISTDATVFLNGKEIGEVHWPSGSIDLTQALRAGQNARLQVLVTAVASEKELKIAMREDYADTGNSGLRQRGIVSDVWLESEPLGPTLAPFQVQTSVKNKRLTVRGEVVGLKSPQSAKVTATVKSWPDGAEVRQFSTEVQVEPGKPFTAEWSWPDPKLWDIGEPNLYTLNLQLEGTGWKDERRERFGFRELHIEGNRLLLNGRNFRARTIGANADQNGGLREAALAYQKSSLAKGYNMLEIWPNDTFRRGFADFRANYASWADETGILLLMPVIRTDDLFSWQETPPPVEPHAKWLAANKQHIESVRNSPSVAGYLFFGNEFMTADDQNPLRLGNREALAQSQQKDVSRAITLLDSLRVFDPTRFFGSHSGGSVGDVQTVNHYMGLVPMQEQEETPALWSAKGDMPYGAVEFCSPFSADMNQARMSWNSESEPRATEFIAAELGARSYEIESPGYRKHIKDRFDPASRKFKGWPGGFIEGVGYEAYPPYSEIQETSFRRIWRSWRTWGIPLGMIQWENPFKQSTKGDTKLEAFAPGRLGMYFSKVPSSWVNSEGLDLQKMSPLQRAAWDAIQPQLAYLGGPAEGDQWVAKDHHFASGEKVRRSAVLVNDGLKTMPYSVQWSVVGTEPAIAGEAKGELPAGEKTVLPVEFPAPEVSAISDLKLSLRVVFGEGDATKVIEDQASLRIYPLVSSTPQIAVSVFDPEGDTSALLKTLGFVTAPWNGGKLPAKSVLVIGRRAMSAKDFSVAAFEQVISDGGRAVIFSQDPKWLRDHAGLRVHHWVGRKFWPVNSQKNHPILAGLNEKDFQDWRGEGTLVPAINEENLATSALRKGYPAFGYRVGSRGSVSSAAWEKPHHSGWTPLLEGEFDLAYSPLMELRYGRGLVLSCSLDVEGREDPAARLIARRVIEAAATLPEAPRRATFYVGNENGSSLLQSMGLEFKPLSGALPPGALLVVGPGAKSPALAVRGVLGSGGRVLSFGQTSEELAALGMKSAMANYGRPLGELPPWAEMNGISASDLGLRADAELPLIQPTGTIQVAAEGLLARSAEGKGVFVAFQGNPSALEADKFLYYRYSQWRWTRALSQLLTNLGGTFSADQSFFKFRQDPYRPIELAGEWELAVEKELPPSASPDAPSLDAQPKTAPPELGWQKLKLPTMNQLGSVNLEKIDGAFWFRRTFQIPVEWKTAGDMNLILGVLDDHDTTFINGNRVGGIGSSDPKAWSKPRSYRVPAWVLKPGEVNTITVRLFDQFGGGGFGAGDAPLSMRLELRKPKTSTAYYIPGFEIDQQMGDDPARYTRW